jgi:hypothetical protein
MGSPSELPPPPEGFSSLPPPPSPDHLPPPPSGPVGDHNLTDVERNRILDHSVALRDLPLTRGAKTFNAKITVDRSTFSAVLLWGKDLTSPVVIVLLGVLSMVTGGFFLPYWLYKTLRPNTAKQTIFIDEHGQEHWRIAPIPPAQRLLSVGIVIAMVCYFNFYVGVLNS